MKHKMSMKEFRDRWYQEAEDWFAAACGPHENDVQKAWPFPTQARKVVEPNREDERKGRALTTVNHDDFSPKPTPKTPEAD